MYVADVYAIFEEYVVCRTTYTTCVIVRFTAVCINFAIVSTTLYRSCLIVISGTTGNTGYAAASRNRTVIIAVLYATYTKASANTANSMGTVYYAIKSTLFYVSITFFSYTSDSCTFIFAYDSCINVTIIYCSF